MDKEPLYHILDHISAIRYLSDLDTEIDELLERLEEYVISLIDSKDDE